MKISSAHRARFGLLAATVLLVVSACATVSAVSPAPRSAQPRQEQPLPANALHSDLRLSPSHCVVPRIEMSADGQRRFLDSVLHCLEQAWEPALRAAGMPTDPVALTVVDAPTSSCTDRPVQPTDPAFYCAGKIYWPVEDHFHQGWGSFTQQYLLYVVMHEYGHHLQSNADILRVADRDIAAAGAQSPLGLELSRRVEMQAQCLAGMTLRSAELGGMVTPGDAAQLLAAQSDIDENPTHGTGRNSRRWVEAGYRAQSSAACDTWSASPGEVE